MPYLTTCLRFDVTLLRTKMHDDTHALFGTQVHRGEMFSGAETGRVPLDALLNAGIRTQDDLPQFQNFRFARMFERCQKSIDILLFRACPRARH